MDNNLYIATHLTAGAIYPIARPAPNNYAGRHVKWTGETRPPRKGEWFLSGALIEGYLATSDLTDSYPIAAVIARDAERMRARRCNWPFPPTRSTP